MGAMRTLLTRVSVGKERAKVTTGAAITLMTLGKMESVEKAKVEKVVREVEVSIRV